MYDSIKLLAPVSAVGSVIWEGETLPESYSGGGTRLSNGSMFQRKLANKRVFMFGRTDTRRLLVSQTLSLVQPVVRDDMRALNK